MSNDVPWRYAVCNEMYEGWSLADVARSSVGQGYQGIELAPYTIVDLVTELSASDRVRLRREVEGQGSCFAGLHWLLARTRFQLNTSDADLRQATANYLLDLVDFCADLGGYALTFGSPDQRAPMGGFSDEEAWSWTVEVMRRCGERAQERGVYFCIEPLYGKPLISGVDDAARLVREVDHPGFRMMVDFRSIGKDPRWSAEEQVRYSWPLFKHVHVNDPNSLGPGMGDLDIGPPMRALRELGYSGWLSLEAGDLALGAAEIARQSMANMVAAMAAE